ncbi:MAG: spermidine/putrescine ABC transporter permease PotC [Desulfovibrionaceae bacterium]
MTRRMGKAVYMACVYLFLYAPIAVLIVLSFNDNKYLTTWKGFTFRWYNALFTHSQLLDAAVHSLTVAALSATLATVLGTLAATAIHQHRFRGRRLLQSALFVVIVSPDIVMGVSLLTLFVALRIELGFITLLLSHITFCLPFVAVTVHARLKDFDVHILEAAEDLGASEYQAFRHVILPLIRPAVLAGWLLSFTLSLDDVIISFFVTGPGFEILPLRIYSMVRLGVKPEVNALSALLVTGTVAVVIASQLLLREKK